jgi:hypothetical protein
VIALAEARLTSIRYKRIDDLVRFVSMTPQPFLNHIERDGKHFYFFLLPFSGGLVVCYFAAGKKIEGAYVTLNRMSGAVSSSSKPTFDAQSVDLAILEVEATDLIDVMKP